MFHCLRKHALLFKGILTPSDEFQYWAETAMTARNASDKERAQHIQEIFQPIAKVKLSCNTQQNRINLIVTSPGSYVLGVRLSGCLSVFRITPNSNEHIFHVGRALTIFWVRKRKKKS